jgi:histidine triad (HIT) family protein
MDCVFCKIINKEIPTDFLHESDKIVAFADIHPKAPVHILVVPKEHINSVIELSDESLAGNLIMAARKIAQDKNFDGYKLVFNVGRAGGQEVDHLHLHLLGGF